MVTVEPSEELLDYVRDLGERAEKVRTRAVGPDEDNMLKITGDGRHAALDLRLVGLPRDPAGKIAAAADRIAGIWAARRGPYPYPAAGAHPGAACNWCSATCAPPAKAGTSTTNSAPSWWPTASRRR